ncbi:hypothetical protein L798_04465, partial [Zootermopsis nevadensis]
YVTLVTALRYRHCFLEGLQCVDLPRCPPIARAVYQNPTLPFALIQLREYICGLNRGTVQVCCHSNSVIYPTPKPRDKEMLPDTSIISHPNFNLINRNCGLGLTDRIVGGMSALPGEFPWLVALQYEVFGELQYLCGGTLISDSYVLTAAHCIAPAINNSSLKLVSLRLGGYNLSSEEDCFPDNSNDPCLGPPRDYVPSELVVHSGFNPNDKTKFRNDVALIRLQTKVELSEYISPVCLPVPGRLTTKKGILSGLNLTVAGWGMTEHSQMSNVIMKVRVPYLDPEICKYNLRGRLVLKGQLCAGGKPKMNACNGDSGGPLIASILSSSGTNICYQVGIVSIGFGSCISSMPSIYTDVEDFIPWILDHIRD